MILYIALILLLFLYKHSDERVGLRIEDTEVRTDGNYGDKYWDLLALEKEETVQGKVHLMEEFVF